MEASLGVLALMAAGLITASPQPRGLRFLAGDETSTAQLSQTVDDVLVTLSLNPNQPGANILTIRAGSVRRPPPAEILRVILHFT